LALHIVAYGGDPEAVLLPEPQKLKELARRGTRKGENSAAERRIS
jgi:hypothetical protein